GMAAIGLWNMDVHIGIAAQTAFLHLAIGHFQFPEQEANLLQVGLGLLGTGQVGLADDFEQRGPGAVEIKEAVLAAARLVVQHLTSVLFQMNADDADALPRRPSPLLGVGLN